MRTLLLLLLLVIAVPTAHAGSDKPGLFGSKEVQRADLSPFPKWVNALERFVAERQDDAGHCKSKTFNRCHYLRWNRLVAKLGGLSPIKQMDAVNRFMNESPYIVDPINWGVEDYWASPGQFFRKSGDCEDYAIAKYLMLRQLGFDTSGMRVVVLQDLNLKTMHAVLVVEHQGRQLMLDNQITSLVETRRVRHYRPIYSLNEELWWLHLS